MILENVKISDLKPLERNVRKHNDKQINELVRSVNQFGQTRAIVIDEQNNILIGNGLYLAFIQMGIDNCQCYRMTGLSETQKKKLILTDNKVYSLGTDDYTEIQNYINDITNMGDFDIAGFDEFILHNMTISEEENTIEMQDYGTITDTKFTQEQPQPQPQPTPQQVEVANIPDKQVVVTENKQPNERRYVLCPNCGEMIYID